MSRTIPKGLVVAGGGREQVEYRGAGLGWGRLVSFNYNQLIQSANLSQTALLNAKSVGLYSSVLFLRSHLTKYRRDM